MLIRPSSCQGCSCHLDAQGFSHPEGRPNLGVALMGEALGEEEAKQGGPFRGKAGFRFERMIERAGLKREDFLILNAAACRPMNPPNREPTEGEIDHCRQYWEPVVAKPEVKVIVPMGNVPLFATLGEEGILSKRGYVWWSEKHSAYILPTVHPSFIMRGNSNWEMPWMFDVRHAVEIAQEGWSPVVRENTLDPHPYLAKAWAETFATRLVTDPTLALGTDIETPDKSIAEDEVDINLGFLAGPIYRIGFAYVWDGLTRTLSIPWDVNYLDTIQFLLNLICPKVFWYRHFDVPRIRAHKIMIARDIHDGMEMWHTLHSDLPRTLEHVTPYLQPRQPAWKHLNHGGTEAYYNATDAGVQVEHYYTLKRLLTETGMWELYRRDIYGLNPILIHMSEKGMPIDILARKKASVTCAELMVGVREKLNDAAQAARPSKTYVQARFAEGLEEITIEKEEGYCTECQKRVPGKGERHPHFKCGVAAGEVPLGILGHRTTTVKAWIKPLDFKPSQKGLIRYADFRGYKLITRWDKKEGRRKTSMDETAVRQYALRYPTDPLWPLVLEERELNKLLGTYIGKLTLAPVEPKDERAQWMEAVNAAGFKDAGTPKDRYPKLVKQAPYVAGEDEDDVPF